MINPFGRIETKGAFSGAKLSMGLHDTLLQTGSVGLGASAAWGAGIGATAGGINGAMSYDGSFLGGAVHGAMVGSIGGMGARFAANTYAKGAFHGATESVVNGVFPAQQGGKFNWSNFSTGWSGPKV